MALCPQCQTDNDPDSRYCKRCGQSLAPGELGDEADDTLILRLFEEPLVPEGPRTARLWLLDPSGERVEKACELREDTTIIGRRPDSTLCLPSNTVSRRHAQIRRAGDHYLLSDLGSTNGTLLNQEPVIGEEPLNDRDEIAVGIFKLIFRCR